MAGYMETPLPKTEPVIQKNNEAITVIEMKHLKKSFGKNQVLRDINLSMKSGENIVILGKSGTGKSVLIKCIVGLIEPDEGELILWGKNVKELKEKALNDERKKVGFLFQSGALYDSMSVRENLEFPIRRLGAPFTQDELQTRVEEALKNVGLSEAINKSPSELSGGMRKRLGLARTLILKPEVMLYDEPTTGLDPITSKEISNLIVDVQQKYKTSSIIITHDVHCARLTANRIIVIKDGVCDAEGTFDELKESEDLWIRSFFE